MAFHSFLYLPFFLGSAVLSYYLVPARYRNIPVFLFSILFYIMTSRQYILFLFITAVTVFWASQLLDRWNQDFKEKRRTLDKDTRKQYKLFYERKKKRLLYSIVLLNFLILLFLKYGNFFGSVVESLLQACGLSADIPLLSLVQPLGISFYTLQACGYLIDISREKYRAEPHFFRFCLFLCFFPQIVEGPIARYDQFGFQLQKERRFDPQQFSFGLQLILWGLFKKIVLADRINMFVNTVFTPSEQYVGLYVVLGAAAYTFQIYTEFSGCIDIVRGSASLFGLSLPENFRQPFSSVSINEFWQRWHMTLGAWIRDYIFYGISFSAPYQKFSKKLRHLFSGHFGKWLNAVIPLFFVWFFMGLWHGASWKYVLYGLYYYILIASGMLLEPLFFKFRQLFHIHPDHTVWRLISQIRTLLFVMVGMLLFRADTFSQAVQMLRSVWTNFSISRLFDSSLPTMGCDRHDMAILLFGFLLVFTAGILQKRNIRIREAISTLPLPVRWGLFYTGIFLVIILGAYGKGYDPAGFIYAQF